MSISFSKHNKIVYKTAVFITKKLMEATGFTAIIYKSLCVLTVMP